MSIEHGFVWMKIIPATASKAAEAKAAGYSEAGIESADRPPKKVTAKSSDRPPKLTIVIEELAAAAGQHTAKFSHSFKERDAAQTWLASDPDAQKWKKGALRCCLVEVSES